MLDLSTENKALCFEDSTLKPLYVFIYYWQGEHWQYFTTIDKAIVMESMELDEGVLEGNSFELGSFVTHSMKVQWQNNGIRYKDMVAVPVQKIGDEYIAYFDGKITKEEVAENGQTVTAEISSLLNEKLDIDVLPTVKAYKGAKLPLIVYNALNKLGIDVRTDWADNFVNADYTILFNESTLPQKLTLAEFLKQVGEFLGGHIVTQEKRVVNSLDDMTSYQPTGRLEIGFIRLANVDIVAESNIKPLPSGYKRLPYIQSTGSQYILTDYVPNINTSVEMQFYNFAKYEYPTDPTNPIPNTTALFGSRSGLLQNSVCCFLSVFKLNEALLDFGNIRNEINTKVLGMRKFALKNGECSVDNTKQTFASQSFSSNVPMAILTVNTNGTPYGKCAIGKLYSFKVFEGTNLVMDMIPCFDTENGVGGLYDLIGKSFYGDESESGFITPNAIETYTLPYYINSMVDKTKKLSIDQIRVLTETGDTQSGQRNYTHWWNDDVKTTYEIKNNIFFEALSAQYWELCENAVKEVGSYLAEQNLYYADLQTVYPPFIEGGDYLIVKGKNQNKLPSGYLVLDNIEINNKNTNALVYINTAIIPNSNNIEIDIDFAINNFESCIFEADARLRNGTILMLYALNNKLLCYIGDYDYGTPFEIPYIPKNQKINFNLKCGNGKYEYSGAFNGSGNYYGADVIYTVDETMALGSTFGRNTNYKLYHFAYSQDGTKLCDMYPCMRKSDGAIGVYDIVQNAFRVIYGNPSPNYESADTVVPVLSTTTRGIHSMRADILCKATNTNKN